MMTLSLRTRLYAVTLLVLTAAVAIGGIGVFGINTANRGLHRVYVDRVVPLAQLKAIADAYAVSIIDAVNKANAGLIPAEATLQGLQDASEIIGSAWNAYLATELTVEERRLADEAAILFAAADEAVNALQRDLQERRGNMAGQLAAFDGPLYESIDPISSKITELVDLQLRVAGEEYTAAEARFRVLLTAMVATLAAGILLGGGSAWLLSQRITRGLGQISAELSASSAQTTAAAEQTSSASQQLASGANEQAAALEESGASMEELSGMTLRNAESAQQAREMALQTRRAADRGSEHMQAMQQAVAAIRKASHETSSILKTIDEIAFQTNILALNAAVEAARAGGAGAGFAVVADEVRALAKRSAAAARDTASRLEEVRHRSEEGVRLSGDVAVGFASIQTGVQNLEQLITNIATATGEQKQGIAQINSAIAGMSRVTQAGAASAEETASTAEELSAQALLLDETVRRLHRIVEGGKGSAPADDTGVRRRPVARRSPAPGRSFAEARPTDVFV